MESRGSDGGQTAAAEQMARSSRLMAEGDKEGALAAIELALAADPFSAQVHLAQAKILEAGLQLPEARAAYQRVLDLKKRSVPACLGLGRCLLQAARPGAALEVFERATALDADNIAAHLGRADALRHLDKATKAVEAYRQVLELDPDNSSAQLSLASLVPEIAPDKLPPDVVARLFDGFAAGYDAHMIERLQHRTPQEIHRAVGLVARPEAQSWRILDLGCGTGLCGPLFRDMAQWLAGVDLSPAMVEKAKALGVYDNLQVGDILGALAAEKGSLDLALAADVFVYLGDLSEVFSACAAALRPGGYFAFTAEITEEGPFLLQTSLRYAHRQDYCETLAAAHGFSVAYYERYVARHERGVPDLQHLFVLLREE